jgi:hypothetical protein
VATCSSEVERIAALEKWFDMKLTEAERRGIIGWRTELNG